MSLLSSGVHRSGWELWDGHSRQRRQRAFIHLQLAYRMLETIVSVSIHKREPAIVGKTDLCRVCSFFGSADGRVNYAVIKHIRQRTTDGRAEGFYIIFSQVRRFSAVGNLVVMQIQLL